jgi:hypothetical protein
MTKDDLDLAFVREFQCGGLHLTGVSSMERHERVRSAIYRNGRERDRFHDQVMTYADAFRQWSGKTLEQRSAPRPDPVGDEDE